MQLADERLDLLIDCLAVAPDAAQTTRLRMALLAEPGAMTAMLNAAMRRQLLSLVLHNFDHRGIVPAPPAAAAGGGTLLASLAAARAELAVRRDALRRGLLDMVGALNGRGIAPLLVKGAVSLWTGDPQWRYQRDFDFRVGAHEVEAALQALAAIGFAPVEGLAPSPHHLQPLSRPGVPAVVEVHTALCGFRAEPLLPDAELAGAAHEDERDGLTVALLRPDHFVLHGLVHHHMQNLGGACGTVSLKGLCEFAHALQALDGAAAPLLARRAAAAPRLAAALDLWTAAAQRLLGLAPPAALAASPRAHARAAGLARRLVSPRRPSLLAALAEELVSCAGAGLVTTLAACAAPLRDTTQILAWRSLHARARKASGIIDALK